ncbi:DNA topoisomerase (ATP-hydrolyzing) subunit B [Blattabacterium punctulatus]|uniref:DNA topoisomerase (ATP-hydrolyzing) subunit B n=1 Tax=Blattabacterium punctulatus TaxID=164514 RepID=UPI000D7C5001|nr:DNA topoisomerase (ATP-hydrolyzing) subunit B [Blattabacterium punctulatus]AWU44568.1 DNA topoisomerase (ATP-hydrolyzing) subunit B [Blattabacterium punctulatus]AWU45654.1 DNA topoisomerase (ATP-hydrolyzing) subunit B [Blattabacterium punctulatus]
MSKKIDYTADSIQSLEGIEHIRMRPSMYIGDVGIRGLHHLVYEVIDNSVDEALAGFCNRIFVTIHKNGFITVIDNGRGIPIEIHKKEGKSALEVVMTKIGAGGKFDKNSYKVSGGLHGVGISCVNALSRTLIVTIYRNGKIYQQEYFKGKTLYNVKCLGKTNRKGTKIYYLADKSIFSSITYDYNILVKRLQELSFLNKGLHLFLKDERTNIENQKKEYFFSKNGLNEYLTILDKNKESLTKNIIFFEGEKDSTIIELAMQYNTSFKEEIYSYVNNIHTSDGGTHLTGFRRALTRTLKKYTDGYIFSSNKDKIEFTGDDFREGITAILSIRVMEPKFEGQTKTKLSNHEVGGIVEKFVGERLNSYLEENPNDRKKIIDKVILAAKARQASKKARELIQKKNPIYNNILPGKLADCSFNDPENCEIYLVEGDSAGGTAKQGRDRKFQAILPLRGKILNVEKAMEYKIFENEEIINIFTSLGVSIDDKEENTKNLNIQKLRYNKIIIMTDADIDGSHISTLILTLFFRYMKPLIEKGHIYIATPPLYLIRKGNRSQYAWSDQERESIVHQLGGRKNNINIQRYKGLGEMNAEQLWETTMNPKKRTLRKINIENIFEADKIFSILMGDEVPPRRNFIEKNAIHAKIDV